METCSEMESVSETLSRVELAIVFIAPVAALAKLNPKFIKDAIRITPEGNYEVRYYEKVKWWPWMKQRLIVIDRIVASSGAASRSGGMDMEMWLPLLEKAYAATRGGYEAISVGGVSADAFAWLTGRAPVSYAVVDLTPQTISELIGEPISVASRLVTLSKKIYANHTYAVIGFSDGLVQLYNPWGFGEEGNDGVDDGVFAVSLDVLKQNFYVMFRCRYNPWYYWWFLFKNMITRRKNG